MKNELNQYAIFMAISLPIQYIAYILFPEVSLMELLFEGEEVGGLEVLSDFFAMSFISFPFLLAPGIFSAIWISRVRSISIQHRWAWIIMSLFLEYFILLFYIASKSLENSENATERV